MMVVANKFNIGETVYLKTDLEQHARLLTGFTVRGSGTITYELSFGTGTSWHYDFEISNEQNVLIKTT